MAEDHLRQEEQPVLAGGQVVAVGAGEDRGGGRHGDEAESLEQSRGVHGDDLRPAWSSGALPRLPLSWPIGQYSTYTTGPPVRRHPMWLKARSSTWVDATLRAVDSTGWSTPSSPTSEAVPAPAAGRQPMTLHARESVRSSSTTRSTPARTWPRRHRSIASRRRVAHRGRLRRRRRRADAGRQPARTWRRSAGPGRNRRSTG